MKNLKYKVFSLIFCITAILSLVTLPSQAAEGQIKNVIYLMPDGGGYGQYDYANAFKKSGVQFDAAKFPNAKKREASPMYITDHLAGSVITRSANAEITDSAAGGTAESTGFKTNNGYMAILPDKTPIATILEAGQEKGMATGLISQVPFYHASPGSFGSHGPDRNDYPLLAKQLENQEIDVVLCGGYGYIEDGSMSIATPKAKGYKIIDTVEKLHAVQPGDKIWADFWSSGSAADYNRGSNQPYFPDLVSAAITALSSDPDGFFLFAEVSHTDNHGNDARNAVSEFNSFSECFEVAAEFAKGRNDTIVIGIADHDTAGMQFVDDPAKLAAEFAEIAVGKNPSTVGWESTNHTAQNVPCFMYVPEGVETIPGLNPVLGDTPETRGDWVAHTGKYVIDNTDMPKHMANLLGLDLAATTKELFVDVTNIGTYTPEGRFEFASGNKYVYPNESVYYEDGVEKSTGGRVTLWLDGKFYVPSVMIDEEDWKYTGGKLNGFFGSGTQEDPYLVQNAYDFIELGVNMSNGEKYAGKYFKQTKDLDLSLYTSEYNGVGSSATFAGVYDGSGYSVNAIISTAGDSCVFPTVSGTIMNFGTTGQITSKGNYAAGIAKKLAPNGKIVNCWSTMKLAGKTIGGLVYNNYGTISNSYFGGSITATKSINALALKHGNGKYENTFYNKKLHQYGATGVKGMTEADMIAQLVEKLNGGRAAAAVTAGVDESDIVFWTQEAGKLPYTYDPTPVIERIEVTPDEVVIKKGQSVQLSATVYGTFNPSQEVKWELTPVSTAGSSISPEGLLTISATETETNFTVIAKSKVDGSKVGLCEVTVVD